MYKITFKIGIQMHLNSFKFSIFRSLIRLRKDVNTWSKSNEVPVSWQSMQHLYAGSHAEFYSYDQKSPDISGKEQNDKTFKDTFAEHGWAKYNLKESFSKIQLRHHSHAKVIIIGSYT